jgi:hypothetical protein
MLRRAKLGVGMLAVGVGMALLPAATASATIEKSAICTAYTKDVNEQAKGSAGLAKEMASGKWSVIQKALLGEFSRDEKYEKDFTAFLNGAPAKVKAAANVALGLDNKFKSIVQNSTSLQQFETAITSAERIPKVTSALAVLDKYAKSLKCGIS